MLPHHQASVGKGKGNPSLTDTRGFSSPRPRGSWGSGKQYSIFLIKIIFIKTTLIKASITYKTYLIKNQFLIEIIE